MKESINRFFESPAYAVVGVSKNKNKFGHIVYNHFKERNFIVYPVNNNYDHFEDEKCYNSIFDLPQTVNSVVTVVPPIETITIVKDCIKKGIKNIWMQPGSESEEAIKNATDKNISLVHGECILMFLEPVKSFHAFHRWVNKLFGKYPK